MTKRRIFQIISYLAIFIWLSFLVQTDSYYSVYLLIGILSIIVTTKNQPPYFTRKRWLEYIISGVLSSAVVLANYTIFSYHFDSNILSTLTTATVILVELICGFIVFLNLTSFITALRIKTSPRQKDTPKKIFFITFLIFSIINLSVLFICCYPGSITSDGIDEIGQILSGNYSNHHPFYFTILIYPFIQIGTNVFHDINVGIALYNVFQILILSLSFAYSFSTLFRVGISKKAILILATIMAILPYNLIFSFTIWKDTLFASSFLVFIVTLYRHFKNLYFYKKFHFLQLLLIFISGLAICLFRSNALISIFVSTIIFLIMFRKQHLKLGITLILIVASAFILKRPVLAAINVSQTDTIESLSIPSQQIARVLKQEKDHLANEDIQLINGVANIDDIINSYNPTTHDPIKLTIRSQGNQSYLKEHLGDFLSLYARLGLKYPTKYIAAWIDITRGYWNSGYNFWIWANEICQNDYGIARQHTDTVFSNALNAYLDVFPKIPLLQPLISIGFTVWILILMFYRAILTKKRNLIFLFLPFLTTWATLIIATPIFSEFRYIYFLFVCLPFLSIITLIETPKSLSKKEHNEK